jgi:hypothetical protein
VTNEIFALISTVPDVSFLSVYETAIDNDGVQAMTKLPNFRRWTKRGNVQSPGSGNN